MFVLLPCYSLEDFSFYMTAKETEEVFSGWTALFHPALLAASGKLPRWETASAPNAQFKRKLVVIPPCCEEKVPTDWRNSLEKDHIPVVTGARSREEIVTAACSLLGLAPDSFDEDIIDSYYAMGFAYFLEELISRKFRYMSDIDTNRVEKFFIQSLEELQKGEKAACLDALQKIGDLLCQTNEYYIPSPGRFLNLTRLETENDLGDTLTTFLKRRRRRDEKTNLFLKPDWLPILKERYPESLTFIREELDAGRLYPIGTEFGPKPLYLLTQAEIVGELNQAQQAYEQYLGRRVTCYGREKAGFTPVLPPLLKMTGFEHTLLFSLDGWKLDKEKQSRIDWVSRSGSLISSLSKEPTDGEDHRAFLRVLEGCGYSYRTDDLGTVIWSHRPGNEVPWWSDIVRINRFVPLIGETLGLEEFFKLTETAGHRRSLGKDIFRTNALTRAAQEGLLNPVSGRRTTFTTRFQTERPKHDRNATQSEPNTTTGDTTVETKPRTVAETKPSFWHKLRTVVTGSKETEPESAEIARYVEERYSRTETEQYYELSNDYFQVRIDPTTGGVKRLTTWDPGQVKLSRGLLRLPGRGNRFSWLPGYRISQKEREADGRAPENGHYGYAMTAADTTEIITSNEQTGVVRITGRLVLPSGKTAGQFLHEISVQRTSRIIDVRLSFQPKLKPTDHAWDNYYGCRFAWRDEIAQVLMGVHEQMWGTERDYLQAPEAVDIRSEANLGITILSGGWPFYRRYGMTRMDMVLLPKNEQAREFRFQIGVDLAHPLRYALDSFADVNETENVSSDASEIASKELFPFRVESEKGTVLAEVCSPGYNETGTCVEEKKGMTSILFQETDGNHTKAVLTLDPTIRQIRRLVRTNQTDAETLPLVDGRVELNFTPHEIMLLEMGSDS